MAVLNCLIGDQGQGKSLMNARISRRLLKRNQDWFAETGVKRRIASNTPFSASFEKEAGEFLIYWSDLKELVKFRGVDVIWDEVADDMDSRNYALLSKPVKRFLSRMDKRGIEIYANTQDWDMVDKRFRKMMTNVYQVIKVCGSPRPGEAKRRPKRVWGFYWVREFENFKDEAALSDPTARKFGIFPHEMFFLTQRDTELFDTNSETGVKEYPFLDHVVQVCEHHGKSCDYKKVVHI